MITPVIGWLRGRSRRREFWLCFAVIMGLITWLPSLPDTAVGAIPMWLIVVIWLLASTRRLRAIGWTAWLSLEPIASLFATAIFRMTPYGQPATEAQDDLLSNITLLAWLGFSLLLGVWPSRKIPVATPEQQAEVFG